MPCEQCGKKGVSGNLCKQCGRDRHREQQLDADADAPEPDESAFECTNCGTTYMTDGSTDCPNCGSSRRRACSAAAGVVV